MFDSIIEKIKLMKQKKCLISLSYILKDENALIYRTGQGLIKRHKSYCFHKFKLDTLDKIKLFYIKDLEEHERLANLKYLEDAKMMQNESIVEADKLLLSELTDEFIETYDIIVLNIQTVAKLHKYLDVEHQELLSQFCNLIKDTEYENLLLDFEKEKNSYKNI